VLATGAPQATDWLRLVQDTKLNLNRIASLLLTPVFANGVIVGLSSTVFNWDTIIAQALPNFDSGIDAVLSSTLSNRTFTMRIVNGVVIGVGEGDLHEDNAYGTPVSGVLGATWTLTIYPTEALIAAYRSNGPRDRCVSVVVVIMACLCMFRLHDWLVRSRSMLLLRLVTATTKIVDDVFPTSVKARMMKQALASQPAAAPSEASAVSQGTSRMLSLIQKLVGIDATERAAAEKSSQLLSAGVGTIADTFPAVTVLFADIAGFTAWAAERPPEVVFAFLGSLWCTFDELCAQRGIFKVESE
jgi:Adenylate and Guanylate cyclase catalytic domain